MLTQVSQEVLFPLPKNGVLVGMACEEAAPGYPRSVHRSKTGTSKARPRNAGDLYIYGRRRWSVAISAAGGLEALEFV